MNKNLISKATGFISLLLFLAALFTLKSCEMDDSMMCRIATYENGTLESAGEWAEYSGAALDEILDEEDITISGRTTRWECK